MENPEKRRFSFGKLKNVEKGLYERDAFKSPPVAETPPADGASAAELPKDVPTGWHDEPMPKKPSNYFRINIGILKKIFWGAAAFFLLAAGISAYLFFGGGNKISTDNVDIVITGPTSVGAGQNLSFGIAVNNKNNVDLEDANLLIAYPPGTRTADASQSQLLRDSENVGSIPTGGVISRNKQAVLFGEANVSEHIIISLEYRVKNSSATYFKEQNYDVLISSSPVSLKIDIVKEAVNGSSVDITAQVVSNSSSPVTGLMLSADYPYGFTFTGASPSPAFGNNTFVLGDLNPADQRVIHIKGTVQGQEGEDRIFRFNLGLPDKNNYQTVGTIFLTDSETLTIKKPFISVDLALDGKSDNPHAAAPGIPIQGALTWSNNLPSRIVNLELDAHISGNSLNRLSVQSGQGFWRSVDNTIVWDRTNSSNFSVVEPNDNGILSFSLSSLPLSTLLYSGSKNNEISIDINVKAQRLSDANVPEEIDSTVSKKIRISSDLGLAGRSLYYTGPFTNQGTIPPKADTPTTYTVVWTITNTLNDVAGVKVQATLPSYMTWTGNTSPAGESITYSSQTRVIEWDPGNISAGTGFSSQPREVAFQVSLLPSLSQLDTSPVLVGPAVIVGTDRWSNATLKDSIREITTVIADPQQSPNNNYSRVVQ